MRKLILLAIATVLAKKFYDQQRAGQMRTPFPTTQRPPEGYEGSWRA